MPRQYTVAPNTLQSLDAVRPEDLTAAAPAAATQPPAGPSLLQRATEALPNVGGMAGSLVGGSKSNPVGMALAAIGGAGGEGFRQALEALQGNWDQVPPDLRSQVTQIVDQGLKQGGLEGAGRYIVGPLTQFLGSGLYRSALKIPKAIRDEFGGQAITDTLVKAGVPITRTGSGTEKVGQLLGQAGQDTQQAIADAEAAGAKPVTIRPVLQSLQRTEQSVADRVIRTPKQEEVQSLRDAALADNPGQIPLSRAQKMKQAEQDLAIQAYKQEARGAPVNSIETSVHEDLARGLKDAIERRVPGIRNKNLRTQQLIGAMKAISSAEGRIANRDPVGLSDALAVGTAITGYHVAGLKGAAVGAIHEALTRPEIASRLGIVMDRSGQPLVTPQVLRTVAESLNQVQDAIDNTK